MFRSWQHRTVCLAFFVVTLPALAQSGTDGAEAIVGDKSDKYVSILSDSLPLLDGGWFGSIRCRTPANGAVTVKIGEALLRIPEDSLRSVVTGALLVKQERGKYRKYLRADTGCAENPIEAALIELSPPASGSFPTFAIKQTPPHQGTTKTTAGLLALRDSAETKPDVCPSAFQGTIVICSGQSSQGPVSYLLAKDKNLALESGAPVHLKCNILGGSFVCGVNDDIAAGVSYSAVVHGEPKDFSLPMIQSAHQQARAIVDGLRIKP